MFNNNILRDQHGFLIGTNPVSAGTGDNAILFIHGFNDSPALWKTWISFFSTNGFHCEAIRLPGSSSDLMAKKSINIEERTEFIKKAFDELSEKYEKIVVCSHSMGGAYSAVMVASGEFIPDVLVLVSPMFEISSHRSPLLTPRQFLQIGSSILLFSDTIENIMPMDIKDKSVLVDYPSHPFVPLSLYDTLFELIDICSTNAPAINIPTIMMISENDVIVNSAIAVNYYENISSAKKVLIVDKTSGHVIPRDFDHRLQAEALLQNLKLFLDK